MYESRDFAAMPILADALQDAGCDNDDILNHCRDAEAGPRPRVLGRRSGAGEGVIGFRPKVRASSAQATGLGRRAGKRRPEGVR